MALNTKRPLTLWSVLLPLIARNTSLTHYITHSQGVPIEELSEKIANDHWLWSRVVAGAPHEGVDVGKAAAAAKAVV